MVAVIGTDEFADWFDGLDEVDTRAVARAVNVLEMAGVTLGHPLTSAIKGIS